MSKVFDGVDDLIDGALGVTSVGSSSPHYKYRTAALRLGSRPASLDTPELIRQILSRIQLNLADPQARWRTKGGSAENWRLERKLEFSPRQKIDEKIIEKLIARDCGDCWVNQVPTASGLLNKSGETHCNIDLVCKTGESCYEFIELKDDDATPLFTAFELVKYSLLFLISRARREEFGYSIERNPLLWARSVRLTVLAPPEYYVRYSLKWLEDELDCALTSLPNPDVALRFRFEEMLWPHDRDCQTALLSRRPVYSE